MNFLCTNIHHPLLYKLINPLNDTNVSCSTNINQKPLKIIDQFDFEDNNRQAHLQNFI